MDDLISRQAAIVIVSHECGEWKGLANEIVKQFNGLPSIQPKQIECEDAISREDAIMCMTGEYIGDMTYKPEDIISKHIKRLRALPSVTPMPKTGHCKDCKWWKDSDGLYRRGGHAESQCPINRREVFEGNTQPIIKADRSEEHG